MKGFSRFAFFIVLLVSLSSEVFADIATQELPRSIVVIPPLNTSIDAGAPYTYLSTISRPLVEKGYYVFPVAVIDLFLKENGLPTPAEMNAIPIEKIREHIGADAVLYVSISEWGTKYQVVQSVTVVKADLKLVDTRTKKVLWTGRVHERYSPQKQNSGGLASLLVDALATQIASSISDRTPELARRANRYAIDRRSGGLPDGPLIRENR